MGELIVSKDVFNALVKIREELDQIIESIEIMNDKKLMEGIDRAMKDVEKGKIYELEDIDELFKFSFLHSFAKIIYAAI